MGRVAFHRQWPRLFPLIVSAAGTGESARSRRGCAGHGLHNLEAPPMRCFRVGPVIFGGAVVVSAVRGSSPSPLMAGGMSLGRLLGRCDGVLQFFCEQGDV